MNEPTERDGVESYDALVARLEKVVGDLEGGQLSLEEAIEKFAEGVKLARDATKRLDEAETKVEILVRSADGGDEEVPFEPAASKGP